MINCHQQKSTKQKIKCRWQKGKLTDFINNNIQSLRRIKNGASEHSPWWSFIFAIGTTLPNYVSQFIAGTYKFNPMLKYNMPDETIIVWEHRDRLFIRSILNIVKPLFKYVISPQCFHLSGPSGVKYALNSVQNAIQNKRFRYFLRIDIKGYYASINHKILIEQINKHFKDARMIKYLEDIITIPILYQGAISLPKQGIARRSSLSPFFGALYLKDLDDTYKNNKGVFYARYMDDIIILTETKKQFSKAKRKLKNILAKLKLECSRHKTKMGVLTRGFHFLGVDFICNRECNNDVTAQGDVKVITIKPSYNYNYNCTNINHNSAVTQIQCESPVLQNANGCKAAKQVECLSRHEESLALNQHTDILPDKGHNSNMSIRLHNRSCARALDKVSVMEEGAVHPADIQRYLMRWANWWCKTVPVLFRTECLTQWVEHTTKRNESLVWLGRGIVNKSLISPVGSLL